MKLKYTDYVDKVSACWIAKNIGGTLGAPFECKRGVWDLEFYTHDLKKGVIPNDDLDLQLVWLNAAEQYGKTVNAEILGEYWLTYIIADWAEYGACKNNMRYGIAPPLSGWYNNQNKNSCGSFIRSEIWACLAPGHPDIAVQYAYEDAIVDHSDEGVNAEMFCAALESAAFVIEDREALVDIALSYIPADCAISKVVRRVKECYENGKDWKTTRKIVLQEFAGTFGMYVGYVDQEPEKDIPLGNPGYDVPSNIGIMMIGWYFGENDFSKSICIAAGCGEDSDCTAATLACVLAIQNGKKAIDPKWIEPIGNEIKYISIDTTKQDVLFKIPKTITELTGRIISLMPTFMLGHFKFGNDGIIDFNEISSFSSAKCKTGLFEYKTFLEKLPDNPVFIKKTNPLYDVVVTYNTDMSVCEGKEKKFIIKIRNKIRSQQWVQCNVYLPKGWEAKQGKTFSIYLDQVHGGNSYAEYELIVIPNGINKNFFEIILEIQSNGRYSKIFLPLVLIA